MCDAIPRMVSLRGQGGIDTRRAAARGWVGLRAPHGRKKPPLCKGRWHGFAVTEGLYLAATPKLFSLRGLGVRYPQGRCVELGGAARPTRAVTLL